MKSCFLTFSCPINAISASFDVLIFQLLIRRQGKTRLCYAARKKKATKITFIPLLSLPNFA